MSELRIKNRSETDLRSCEVTKAVTNKAQKKIWGFNGIRTHDLRDTGATLYGRSIILSYNGYKLNSQLTCSRGGFIAQNLNVCLMHL